MLKSKVVGSQLKSLEYEVFSGVPCSILKELFRFLANDAQFIIAADEGESVAIAVGATLAGKKACIFLQNSGLGNAVSPLSSLSDAFKIPILGFLGYRGRPGQDDEPPQHRLMGQITEELLTSLRIKYSILSNNPIDAKEQIRKADSVVSNGESYFLLVAKDTFQIEKSLTMTSLLDTGKPSRSDIIKAIALLASEETIIIASTGYISRELFQLADRNQNFYMVGSMGCAASLALGVAISAPEKKVIVIEGDGAFLMRLGTTSTIASMKPSNLLHIVVNNGAHESTGGQKTAARHLDLAGLVKEMGYAKTTSTDSLQILNKEIQEWNVSKQLSFIEVKSTPGTIENLIRPKEPLTELAKRFTNEFDPHRKL